MRIECINAETDRYLPVLFISEEDTPSEVSEAVKQDANTTPTTATEECIVVQSSTEQAENIVSTMKVDDASDEESVAESEDNLVREDGSTNEQLSNTDETPITQVVAGDCTENFLNYAVDNDDDNHETDTVAPEIVNGDEKIVSISENMPIEDIVEEPGKSEGDTGRNVDNISIFRSEDDDSCVSSLFKNDVYEEEYGDMVAPRIQKMKKKITASAKKPLKKNTTSEKQKSVFSNTTTIVSQTNAINHHFETNGFLVVESSKSQTIAGLKNLTYQIGENYTYTAPLLKEVRKAICAPNVKGGRNLCFKFDKSAGSFYHKFCNTMKQFGLFTKYFINGNVLTATISPVPRVISYLNGQWLEMYSSYILEDVVSEYAKTKGYEYEILTNVKVTNITSVHVYAHEIDCVISIGDKCFAFEMKSGQFDDYNTLYNTRKELHFVPDRYLLLYTGLEEETADTLQYFYEFYITGMNGFKNRLIEMIDKAFAN